MEIDKMKENLNKNKELIVAIFVVLLLIITGSYAWLTLTKTSEKVNVIKAGSLYMELDDSATEGIKLINTLCSFLNSKLFIGTDKTTNKIHKFKLTLTILIISMLKFFSILL